MRAVVGCGDAANLFGTRIGVVQPADQVIDSTAGGVDQQDLAAGSLGGDANPVLPLLGGSIQIRQLLDAQVLSGDRCPRQGEQRHAQSRCLLQFRGAAVAAGAHHAATGASDPMLRADLGAKHRQQPRQVGGVTRGGEDEGEIGFALGSAQLLDHIPYGFIQGRFARQPCPATGFSAPGAKPAERCERCHEADLINPGAQLGTLIMAAL